MAIKYVEIIYTETYEQYLNRSRKHYERCKELGVYTNFMSERKCKKRTIVFEPISGLMDSTYSMNAILDSYEESKTQYQY